MIASVRGRVAQVGDGHAVLLVGGLGLEVGCTARTLRGLRTGQEATIPTVLVVREDSLTLFGFADEEERQLFVLLQTASGVGPRLAQAVLAVHTPDAVRRAVATGDLAALTRVPGIGRKGAERLVLELRDRLGPPPALADGPAADGLPGQVQAGLLGLGYSAREAEEAAAALDPGQVDAAVALRAALAWLRRR